MRGSSSPRTRPLSSVRPPPSSPPAADPRAARPPARLLTESAGAADTLLTDRLVAHDREIAVRQRPAQRLLVELADARLRHLGDERERVRQLPACQPGRQVLAQLMR